MFYLLPDPSLFPGLVLRFDVSKDGESVKFPATITAHPVERGSTMTDHVIADPIEFELVGIVTNTPVNLYPEKASRGNTSITTIRIPGNRTPSQARASANPITGEVTVTNDFVDSGGRNLSITSLNFTSEFNAIREMVLDLKRVRDAAALCSVITKDLRYDNILIGSFDYQKIGKSAAEFTVSCQQVTLVDNQRVEAPQPSEPRGQPQAAKGNQEPEKKGDFEIPSDPKGRASLAVKAGTAFGDVTGVRIF